MHGPSCICILALKSMYPCTEELIMLHFCAFFLTETVEKKRNLTRNSFLPLDRQISPDEETKLKDVEADCTQVIPICSIVLLQEEISLSSRFGLW